MSEEQKQAAWDVVRACFYLLAGMIWAQILMSFAVWASCAYGVLTGIAPPGVCKDLVPNVMELMVGGMAVVLAFAGRGK
jgi:hypothetical protein